MSRISFSNIVWEEPTPRVRRRSRAWLSPVGVAFEFIAGAVIVVAVVWYFTGEG